MRAAEFIRALATVIDALDGDTDASTQTPQDNQELQNNPVMIAPQQQEIELSKAELGKMNPAIAKLIASDDIGEEGTNATPHHIGSDTPGRRIDVKSNAPVTFLGKAGVGVR